jgi:AbrB family looped-hinge helix DNA binding protein
MARKVGLRGEVVIPKALRVAAGLEPGDEVRFSLDGHGIRIERVASPDALMGSLAGHRLVDALEKDRRTYR